MIQLPNILRIVSVLLVNPSINETESAEYLSSQRELFRGLNGLSDEYDLVIVGAGLSGSVIAQQASSRAGLRSLIIDKRDHIGGNCFDYVDEHGIRVTFTLKVYRKEYQKLHMFSLPQVSKYGAHIFHTKSKRVWNYVQQFSTWMPYSHRVKASVRYST